MKFIEIIPFINEGWAVRRKSYKQTLIIFKQEDFSIDCIEKYKLISEQVRNLLFKYKVGMDYTNIHLIYDFETGETTYCIYDTEDINADDWEIVRNDYNPFV